MKRYRQKSKGALLCECAERLVVERNFDRRHADAQLSLKAMTTIANGVKIAAVFDDNAALVEAHQGTRGEGTRLQTVEHIEAHAAITGEHLGAGVVWPRGQVDAVGARWSEHLLDVLAQQFQLIARISEQFHKPVIANTEVVVLLL